MNKHTQKQFHLNLSKATHTFTFPLRHTNLGLLHLAFQGHSIICPDSLWFSQGSRMRLRCMKWHKGHTNTQVADSRRSKSFSPFIFYFFWQSLKQHINRQTLYYRKKIYRTVSRQSCSINFCATIFVQTLLNKQNSQHRDQSRTFLKHIHIVLWMNINTQLPEHTITMA